MQKYPDMEKQTLNEILKAFGLLNFFTAVLRNDLIPVSFTVFQIVASSQVWFANKKSRSKRLKVETSSVILAILEPPLHL